MPRSVKPGVGAEAAAGIREIARVELTVPRGTAGFGLGTVVQLMLVLEHGTESVQVRSVGRQQVGSEDRLRFEVIGPEANGVQSALSEGSVGGQGERSFLVSDSSFLGRHQARLVSISRTEITFVVPGGADGSIEPGGDGFAITPGPGATEIRVPIRVSGRRLVDGIAHYSAAFTDAEDSSVMRHIDALVRSLTPRRTPHNSRPQRAQDETPHADG